MLVKNIGHLLVLKIFSLCVYLRTISQVGGYQCRKNNWDIINSIQSQSSFGKRKRIRRHWEKRKGRRDEVKVVPWRSFLLLYMLFSCRTLRQFVGYSQECHYSQGLYRHYYYGGKLLSSGKLFLSIHWAWLTEKPQKVLSAKLKLLSSPLPLDICLFGTK